MNFIVLYRGKLSKGEYLNIYIYIYIYIYCNTQFKEINLTFFPGGISVVMIILLGLVKASTSKLTYLPTLGVELQVFQLVNDKPHAQRGFP